MRLYELRNSHGITQKQLAEAIGVTIRTITNYENGSRKPDIDTLIAIADYFRVSLDYLCGLTDDVEKRGEIVYPQFAGRLQELRKSKNLDIWAFAELFDISARNYAGYEIGETMPDLPVIAMFADYFDVSLDYLVGRSDNPARQ
jgi:transcriptional regulator with XRE-family HTH domain